MSAVPEITPQDVKAKLDAGEPIVLLDVREAFEHESSTIEGNLNIPMTQVPRRVSELDKEAFTVVICRTGNRSGQVTNFLKNQGFTQVFNMVGGMNRWSEEIDPTQKVY